MDKRKRKGASQWRFTRVDISRNSLLMDTVRIIFLVQNDGSVTNVRILPPGSNSFQVDRQLREWRISCYFEKQEENKQSAEAVITIHPQSQGVLPPMKKLPSLIIHGIQILLLLLSIWGSFLGYNPDKAEYGQINDRSKKSCNCIFGRLFGV